MEPTREQAYRRRIAELEVEVAALKAEVARLAELVAKLSKKRGIQLTPVASRGSMLLDGRRLSPQSAGV